MHMQMNAHTLADGLTGLTGQVTKDRWTHSLLLPLPGSDDGLSRFSRELSCLACPPVPLVQPASQLVGKKSDLSSCTPCHARPVSLDPCVAELGCLGSGWDRNLQSLSLSLSLVRGTALSAAIDFQLPSPTCSPATTTTCLPGSRLAGALWNLPKCLRLLLSQLSAGAQLHSGFSGHSLPPGPFTSSSC